MISRPELRWKNFWWVGDWAILIVVIVASIIPNDELHRVVPDFNDKLTHGVTYFGMTLWIAGSLDPRRYEWLAIVLCAVGIGIEGLQFLMNLGREADWRDVIANSFGIMIALAVAHAGLGNWMAWVERRFART